MAEYNDLQQIERLHAEQAQIEQALMILEDYAGTVSHYTVAPTASSSGSMPPMSVQIFTVDPGQNLMASVHASLVQRYNAINKELRDLGVTGGPPDHAQGGGPQPLPAP